MSRQDPIIDDEIYVKNAELKQMASDFIESVHPITGLKHPELFNLLDGIRFYLTRILEAHLQNPKKGDKNIMDVISSLNETTDESVLKNMVHFDMIRHVLGFLRKEPEFIQRCFDSAKIFLPSGSAGIPFHKTVSILTRTLIDQMAMNLNKKAAAEIARPSPSAKRPLEAAPELPTKPKPAKLVRRPSKRPLEETPKSAKPKSAKKVRFFIELDSPPTQTTTPLNVARVKRSVTRGT